MSSSKISQFVANSLGLTQFRKQKTNHLQNYLQRNSKYHSNYHPINVVATCSIIDKQGNTIGIEGKYIYKNHDYKKKFFSAEQIHYHRSIKSHFFWVHTKDGKESEIFDILRNEKPILIAPFFDEDKSQDLLKQIPDSQIVTVQ